MKRVAALLGACAAISVVVACSHAQTDASGQDAADGGNTGALHVEFTLPGGTGPFSEIAYQLTFGAALYAGTHSLGDAGAHGFTLGGVPAGNGYALSLIGETDDGAITCAFPTPGVPAPNDIDIAPGKTTELSLALDCTINPELNPHAHPGQAVNRCPVWNAITASELTPAQFVPLDVGDGGDAGIPSLVLHPATTSDAGVEVLPGEPSSVDVPPGKQLLLLANASAPDPGDLTFTWTTTGGTVVGASGIDDRDGGFTNEAVFTCPPGVLPSTNVVTLTLSDEPTRDADSCAPAFTTATVTVSCSGMPDASIGDARTDGD